MASLTSYFLFCYPFLEFSFLLLQRVGLCFMAVTFSPAGVLLAVFCIEGCFYQGILNKMGLKKMFSVSSLKRKKSLVFVEDEFEMFKTSAIFFHRSCR